MPAGMARESVGSVVDAAHARKIRVLATRPGREIVTTQPLRSAVSLAFGTAAVGSTFGIGVFNVSSINPAAPGIRAADADVNCPVSAGGTGFVGSGGSTKTICPYLSPKRSSPRRRSGIQSEFVVPLASILNASSTNRLPSSA